MRLIDADALFINLDGMMEVSPTGYIHGDTVADMISDAPTVDAIPVEYIEYEKDRINRFIQIAVKHGDMKEADRLTAIVAVMDAIISNWRYTTGPDWRGERKEE